MTSSSVESHGVEWCSIDTVLLVLYHQCSVNDTIGHLLSNFLKLSKSVQLTFEVMHHLKQ